MSVKTITIEELKDIVQERKGAQIVTLGTMTDAKLLKTGNPYKDVKKVSRVNGVINFNYSAAVNRQREREGNEEIFEAKPRAWGQRIQGTPLIEHKGEFYLEMKVERSLGHWYLDENGNDLNEELIEPFKPKKSSSTDHQGVEKEIVVRDFKLRSILQLTIGGQDYEIAF